MAKKVARCQVDQVNAGCKTDIKTIDLRTTSSGRSCLFSDFGSFRTVLVFKNPWQGCRGTNILLYMLRKWPDWDARYSTSTTNQRCPRKYIFQGLMLPRMPLRGSIIKTWVKLIDFPHFLGISTVRGT